MNVGDKVKVIRKDRNYGQKGIVECFDDEPNGDGVVAVKVKFKWCSIWYYPEHLKIIK